MGEDKRKFIVLLITTGFLLYANSLFNGFVWDDEEQIVNNISVHSLANWPKFFQGGAFYSGGTSNLLGIYFKPLMTLTFSLLYSLFGPNPAFFHLLSLIVHIANSVLVFLLFYYLLTKLDFKPDPTIPSFLASLVFLVHPIYSEVVLYAANVQDLLYFFFGILSLILVAKNGLSTKKIFFTSFLLLLSLLSKETGVLFGLLVVVYAVFVSKKKVVPLSLSTAAAFATYLFMRLVIAHITFSKYDIAPIARIPLGERLTNIPKIISYYLSTLVFPYNLVPNQHWIITGINFQEFYLPLVISIVFFGAISFLGFWLWKKKDKNFSLYLFFLLWFILSFGAHLQILPLDVTVSGRWFYMPMVGLLGLLTVGANLLAANKIFARALIAPIATVLILTLAFASITFARIFDWRSGLTLYGHDIEIVKNDFNLENNLGVELFRAGRYKEAGSRFENSAKLAPYWWTNWNNLGASKEHDGDIADAEADYKKAIENGGYYLAYENLASLYLFKEKDAKKAAEFTKSSLQTLPENPKLWLILALADYQIGEKEGAAAAAKNAYLLQPSQETEYVYINLLEGKSIDLK